MEVRTQRGGMCSNPFGGRMRLDRLNLMELLNPGDPSEKALFLQTMTDAIHNYMFFGLGRNGPQQKEFAFACEYLFRIRGKRSHYMAGSLPNDVLRIGGDPTQWEG
jgi:hypothetical protein